MIRDPSIWLAAAGIAAAGGAFRGFAGFGSGLLMAPLLALVLSPSLAVPVMLLLSFAASFRLLPDVRHRVEPRRVAWLAVPAIVTIPVGVWVLTVLDGRLVQRLISLCVLILVIFLATGWRHRGRVGALVTVPTGLLSGLLTGVGGVGGPPVVLLLMSDEAPAETTRANLIAFFAIAQVAAIVTLVVDGLVTRDVLLVFGVTVPCFLVPLHFGARFFDRTDDETFRRVALVFLGGVALAGLLWPR